MTNKTLATQNDLLPGVFYECPCGGIRFLSANCPHTAMMCQRCGQLANRVMIMDRAAKDEYAAGEVEREKSLIVAVAGAWLHAALAGNIPAERMAEARAWLPKGM